MSEDTGITEEIGLPHLGKFWTAANVLTMLRGVLTLPVVYLILRRDPHEPAGPLLLFLVVLAIATDWFDGKIARWSKTVSDWGKVLDPLVDKFAAFCTLVALAVIGSVPWWFVVIMVARDAITGIGWSLLSHRKGRIFMSRMSGKTATAAVGVTVLAALLVADPEVMNACIWITTTLLIYSFIDYTLYFIYTVRSSGNGSYEDEPEPNDESQA